MRAFDKNVVNFLTSPPAVGWRKNLAVYAAEKLQMSVPSSFQRLVSVRISVDFAMGRNSC